MRGGQAIRHSGAGHPVLQSSMISMTLYVPGISSRQAPQGAPAEPSGADSERGAGTMHTFPDFKRIARLSRYPQLPSGAAGAGCAVHSDLSFS